MIQIESAEEASSTAYNWASARGKDAAQISAFAENLFNEQQGKPLSSEMLEVHLQHFSNATSASFNAWSRYAAESWTHQTTWAIETVKHLAITNVAGIAGAAALLAGGKFFNGLHLKIATVSFTFGLLMALLDFWIVSVGYSKRASDQDSRAHSVRNASSWPEYIHAEPKYIDKGKRWFSTADFVGWVSAISAIAGALCWACRYFWPMQRQWIRNQ